MAEAENDQMRAGVEQALSDYRAGRLTKESGVVFGLVCRLAIAEDVCLVSGWTPMADSERGKALHELWARWYGLVGEEWAASSNHPHLDDAHLAELAGKRDAARAATLKALFGEEAT